MSDITGPISSLPGSGHSVPDGMTCDRHPDRQAVHRVQGETDSFGCEMIDMCQECWKHELAYRKSDEAKQDRIGECGWCKREATDLCDARDYDEGMYGPVYRVCGACLKRHDDRIREELDRYGWDE